MGGRVKNTFLHYLSPLSVLQCFHLSVYLSSHLTEELKGEKFADQGRNDSFFLQNVDLWLRLVKKTPCLSAIQLIVWRNAGLWFVFIQIWMLSVLCNQRQTFRFPTVCRLLLNKKTLCPYIFQCVKNSRSSLPLATVNMVKNYPEMTDWVHSVHYTAPFYISSNNYTKIVVDRVQAADQSMYNILFLATGMFTHIDGLQYFVLLFLSCVFPFRSGLYPCTVWNLC